MGWWSDRWEAAKESTTALVKKAGDVANSVVEVVKDPVKAVKEAGSAIKEVASKTIDSVGNGLSIAGNAIKDTTIKAGNAIAYAYENPGEIISKVGDSLQTAFDETYNFGAYFVNDPVRGLQLVGQGLQNAVTSTVAVVGDLAVIVVYDYNPARMLLSGAADFVGIEAFEKRDNLFGASEWAGDNWQWAGEPRNGYEKTLLYGTQAIGEIAAMVATGGATAAVKGAATGVRGTQLLVKTTQGAKAMVGGLKAEAAFAGLSMKMNWSAATSRAAAGGAVLSVAEQALAQENALTTAQEAINAEMTLLNEQFKATENEEQREAIIFQYEELVGALEIISEIRNEGTTPEERELLTQDLAGTMRVTGVSSRFTRPDNSGEMTKAFNVGVDKTAPKVAAVVTADNKATATVQLSVPGNV